ncbi:eukaryotic translation initiation factor 4E transporter-like isoform X4 [Cotesia glomerata]|uniref:eukaryotic translation initiation factor 4E transporter-like isoform X4 n=1 Tax=Cotesia glomerata TaxID=32391 RepID=UPI001D02A88F|nr:eukaryotic translation initiation factor 4E transporter-like isoform X4 [Cotesia glomerata]
MKINIIEIHEPTNKKRRRRKRKLSAFNSKNCSNSDENAFLPFNDCKLFCRQSIEPYNHYFIQDEAIISVAVAGEVTDSCIVEVGRVRPQFQYTREELMTIKGLPLSKRRPECLDAAYNKCLLSSSRGLWDPERWHLDRKRSETPPEEEQRPGGRDQVIDSQNNKRRSGDPRERIRKEQDGIVLSPQRRSFNSGCFVNVTQPTSRRPESPIGKPEVVHREPVRRIGSGRLLTRDMWDFRPENEKMEPDRPDYGFRSGGNSARDRDSGRERENLRDRDSVRDRDDRNERYERRSFGRDFGDRDNRDRDRGSDSRNDRGHVMDRDKDRGGRDRKYGSDRRKIHSHDSREPEEPEWFSSGPISQHDTIELRGFDDLPEEKTVKSKKISPAQKKRGKKSVNEKDDKPSENSAGPKGRSTPTSIDQPTNPVPAPHSPILEKPENETATEKKQSESNDNKNTQNVNREKTEQSESANKREAENLNFNLEDFLKSDNLPGVSGLLTNGVGANSGSGSRFSQWFKRESPLQQNDSRRPSIQDELLNNLLSDITEPNIQVPIVNESNTYFAPISPANSTNINNAPSASEVKLLEMLQRGNKSNQNGQGDTAINMVQMLKTPSVKDIEVGSKGMHSLEELEASLRGGVPPQVQHVEQQKVNKTEEDLSAFKKLLAQVSGGQAVPAANGLNPSKGQPITLMQLLKNQQPQPPIHIPPHQPIVPEQPHPNSFGHVGPLGPTQHAHQAQMQHENLLKVLRIQQQQQQQQQQHKRQQQSTDMLSMMMGTQRMVGVSPVPQEMQMLGNNIPSIRELLQRPEAQAIIQGLQQGEITRQHLVQQLQNPAMQHRHRELLMNILRMFGNTASRTVSPHPGSGVSHDPMIQQLLYQQQQQQQQHQHQQQRVPSPMNNALCQPSIITSNLVSNSNPLSMQHSVIPHRAPSPRDLIMHPQSMMQNALIKNKLEEQRESYRKRQEHQQQQQQQRIASPINSPSKQIMSPTPLAFTPTSVLRKMTAEKEPDGTVDNSKMVSQSQVNQIQQMQSAVQIIAQAQGVFSRQQNTMRTQPNPQVPWTNQLVNKHPGRPIVKGGAANQFQYGNPVNYPQQSQPQQQLPQQQQPPSSQRITPSVFGNTARSKHTMSSSLSHQNFPPYNMTPNPAMSRRPDMTAEFARKVAQVTSMDNEQPQQQQRNVNSQVQLILNQNYNTNRTDGRVMRPQQPISMGRQTSPGSNGGSLSPTSNQLARWFSPELLAKARAGKLPELGQTNVLSLEELERLQQASAVVHD